MPHVVYPPAPLGTDALTCVGDGSSVCFPTYKAVASSLYQGTGGQSAPFVKSSALANSPLVLASSVSPRGTSLGDPNETGSTFPGPGNCGQKCGNFGFGL